MTLDVPVEIGDVVTIKGKIKGFRLDRNNRQKFCIEVNNDELVTDEVWVYDFEKNERKLNEFTSTK